eukprot:g1104.t1
MLRCPSHERLFCEVAKRVAWLNKFGHLSQSIDWPEVAEPLDNLKVPHAMVLLKELETLGKKVKDPTEWIKRAVEQAGCDDIDPEEASLPVKAKVQELNQSGRLAAPIDLEQVKDGLARLETWWLEGPQAGASTRLCT